VSDPVDETSQRACSPFPLRDYALIADGERGALIGPLGEIAWLCAPGWDSPSVFGELIGAGGLYVVTPTDSRFVWGGFYKQGSLVWHSRWITSDGIIECREALAAPGDPHHVVVLRRILAVKGDAKVHAVLEPRSGFGRHELSEPTQHHGRWTARSGPLQLRWDVGDAEVRCHDRALEAVIEVTAGSHHDLVLELSDRALPHHPIDPVEAWRRTTSFWADSRPPLRPSVAPTDAEQAWAVMRGLTARSGAMVASATMSLPERAEAGRNYDYRYAWIRDQCLVGQSAAAAGAHELLDAAVRFVAERIACDGPDLKPAYTVSGDQVPDEQRLGLPGYPGGVDIRGNQANTQFQLDIFGEALLLLGSAADADRLDADHWATVEAAVGAIEQRWREPDAGIWELEPRRWAHSRLACVAGLRRITPHAPATRRAAWCDLADVILADVTSDCVHHSGRWQRSPGDERVDAALLFPAVRGALPATDPRSRATFDAVVDDLEREGFVYRFRPDGRPLGRAEGAFVLCGFLAALAAHQRGDERRALQWFERGRAACGPPGLLAEEFDVNERQLRGNLPQAFAHALLLETACRLAER
jgi:GH15 family glucan-1,4-alpha-glucosidase